MASEGIRYRRPRNIAQPSEQHPPPGDGGAEARRPQRPAEQVAPPPPVVQPVRVAPPVVPAPEVVLPPEVPATPWAAARRWIRKVPSEAIGATLFGTAMFALGGDYSTIAQAALFGAAYAFWDGRLRR